MNSLDREIQEGEVVVLAEKYFKPEYQSLENRLFKVEGGFGMNEFTSGKALYGKFLSDGEECRQEGFMISPKETEKFQKEFGVFGEKYEIEAAT